MRITPAWAGKSFSITARGRVRRDHPRVGGEKPQALPIRQALKGSPPRGRGKAAFRAREIPAIRITPAWAGKSSTLGAGTAPLKDHPRVGGEKVKRYTDAGMVPGSPPRGRGKDVKDKAGHLPAGITPAWAGKSIQSSGPLHTAGDHPRVGGEKRPDLPSCLLRQGSPPRGRGKVPLPLVEMRCLRITPAWAGKS